MLDERVLVTTLRLLHPLVLNTFDERLTSKELHAYAIFEFLNHFKSRNDATAAEISWERSLAQRILSVYRKYLSEFVEHHSIDAGNSRMTSATTNALGFSTYGEWKRSAELLLVKWDDGFSDAAYLAAISSFEQVLGHFRHSDTFWSFNLQNLTSFLVQKVLNSFHSFCQGYSLENGWSFIHLAIIIKVAGYIAQEIFNSDLNQRYLTESEAKYEYFLTYIFKNTSSEDTFLADTSILHLDTSHLNDTLVDADDDLVGVDDDLLKIKDQLTGLPSKLRIIPIVGFSQLKFLLLESLDLVHWEASSEHFSKLEYLVLKNCIFLDEIPHGIGDIDMLQLIELDNCSFSAIMSAKRIQKEQLSKGNDNISFRIGQTLHQLKLVIFAWAFIHMTSVLKKQWREHDQL